MSVTDEVNAETLAERGFDIHELDEAHWIAIGHLDDAARPNQERFEQIWNLHPPDFPEIQMIDKMVKIPRWQQAYGKDYRFSRQVSQSRPIPAELETIFQWTVANVDDRLNTLLVNWYDGQLGHYIGKHRDSTDNMISGAPIVTISLGETRVFRLRPYRQTGYHDFFADPGTAIVIPYHTNLKWTHEVPKFKRYRRRRVSVTLRAFG